MVPVLVEKCVSRIRTKGMSETGIFRLSGRQSRVKQLKEAFSTGMTFASMHWLGKHIDHAGEDVDLSNEQEVHAVASLLKVADMSCAHWIC